MDILRTPDERFVGLTDYPVEPHYQTINDAREVVISTAYAVVIFSILVQATSLRRVIAAVLPPA